jgi:hypothetical protein
MLDQPLRQLRILRLRFGLLCLFTTQLHNDTFSHTSFNILFIFTIIMAPAKGVRKGQKKKTEETVTNDGEPDPEIVVDSMDRRRKSSHKKAEIGDFFCLTTSNRDSLN